MTFISIEYTDMVYWMKNISVAYEKENYIATITGYIYLKYG